MGWGGNSKPRGPSAGLRDQRKGRGVKRQGCRSERVGRSWRVETTRRFWIEESLDPRHAPHGPA